ncbi:MAG: type III toxin-antitoxin system ToxN/AbiQ family toxin [Fibrobacter sp.]|nr:type III toxin-antitoxin system ToxN/AbiQ family toxin [Fibrobacter sp.]
MSNHIYFFKETKCSGFCWTWISSGKQKHTQFRETNLFYKVYLHNETDEEKLVKKPVAVIDLKHIVPVPSAQATPLANESILNNDAYGSPSEKSKYLVLLRQELAWVNHNEERIVENAKILHNKCMTIESFHIHKRCLNLRLLEQKAKEISP